MVAEWFVLSNNQTVGPYTASTLLHLLRSGDIHANSLVRRLDGPWMPAAAAIGKNDFAPTGPFFAGHGPSPVPGIHGPLAPPPVPPQLSMVYEPHVLNQGTQVIDVNASPAVTRSSRKRGIKVSKNTQSLLTVIAIALGAAAAYFAAPYVLAHIKSKYGTATELIVEEPSQSPTARPTSTAPTTREPIKASIQKRVAGPSGNR